MKYLLMIASLSLTACTTVGQSIHPYKEPVIGCKFSKATPIEQAGLPSLLEAAASPSAQPTAANSPTETTASAVVAAKQSTAGSVLQTFEELARDIEADTGTTTGEDDAQ